MAMGVRSGVPARSLLLIFVVGVVVIAGISGTILVVGVTPPAVSSHPSVSFDAPTGSADGFSFRVQAVSTARGASNYRVNLEVNDSLGFALPLGPAMQFQIGGTLHTLNWVDADGGGRLTAGDTFAVHVPGGPPPQTTYTVILLWRDGTALERVPWGA